MKIKAEKYGFAYWTGPNQRAGKCQALVGMCVSLLVRLRALAVSLESSIQGYVQGHSLKQCSSPGKGIGSKLTAHLLETGWIQCSR